MQLMDVLTASKDHIVLVLTFLLVPYVQRESLFEPVMGNRKLTVNGVRLRFNIYNVNIDNHE